MPWNELRKQRKENQFLKLCQTASQDSIALLDHNQNILWSNPHWADVSSRVGEIFTKELIDFTHNLFHNTHHNLSTF